MKLKSAIVVIDVQNALCVGEFKTYMANEVIAKINLVIAKARRAQLPIMFIQHGTKGGILAKGAHAWELSEELDRISSDMIVEKSASDAFHNTALKSYLNERGINHLVVCGMQSEFCVDSTVRRALALNFAVTIVADAHTTADNDVIPAATISKHHNVTWENISSYEVSANMINAKNIKF